MHHIFEQEWCIAHHSGRTVVHHAPPSAAPVGSPPACLARVPPRHRGPGEVLWPRVIPTFSATVRRYGPDSLDTHPVRCSAFVPWEMPNSSSSARTDLLYAVRLDFSIVDRVARSAPPCRCADLSRGWDPKRAKKTGETQTLLMGGRIGGTWHPRFSAIGEVPSWRGSVGCPHLGWATLGVPIHSLVPLGSNNQRGPGWELASIVWYCWVRIFGGGKRRAPASMGWYRWVRIFRVRWGYH